MKKFWMVTCLFVIFSLIVLTSCSSNGNTNKDVVVSEDSCFELNLYKELEEDGENLIFSPYSLVDAVSLMYTAADETIIEEMRTVLGLSDDIVEKYKSYDNEFKDGESLLIANKVFYDKSANLNTGVLARSELQKLDLKREGVDEINAYVSGITKNHINNLLSENDLNLDSVLVLINALYFNKNFNYTDGTIEWSDGKIYDAFKGEADLKDIKEVTKDIDLIRLQYIKESQDDHTYSLYILCDAEDSKKKKINDYLSEITGTKLYDLLNFTGYEGLSGYDEAKFIAPDFELSYQGTMKEPLRKLGLTEAFNRNTKGFSKLGDVYISDIIQSSYINTSEKGTEATSATAIISAYGMAAQDTKPPKVKNVIVDDEFVYVIKDDTSDIILFMGKVSKPTTQADSDTDIEIIEEEKMEEIVSTKTDLDIYRELLGEDKERNMAFSPYSIKDCFSIIAPYVNGETKEQIDAVLGYDSTGYDFYTDYDNYIREAPFSGLKVANRAFLNKYEKINSNAFSNTELESIEMNEEAVGYINHYIADTTNDKIKNLLKPSDITSDTVLVLVNALHFLKSWDFDETVIQFGSDNLNYKGFKKDDLGVWNAKEVDAEIDIVKLSYTMSPEEMAYSGNLHNYSMYIICDSVNSDNYNVDDFMDNLTYKEFKDLLDFTKNPGLTDYDSVTFKAPNFEADYKESLVQSLANLGLISGLMTETEDFENISKSIGKIDDVIHGAYIHTDYKGTEAAAATVVTMVKNMGISFSNNVKEIVVDSPFVFVIKDDTSDVVLFMGRIQEPCDKV